MAPCVIRRFIFAGALGALAVAMPLAAAEKTPPPIPVADPSPDSPKQMPPADATHAEFVAWLRTTDLGKMLRRDESVYTIERTKNGTIMRLDAPAFSDVLVMVIPTTKEEEALPICINTERDAEALFRGKKKTELEKP